MSNARRDRGPVVVGGEPRIDFLPAEIKNQKENRRKQRSLVFLVIAVALACAVGIYFSFVRATASQVALVEEQAKTDGIIQAQAEYFDLRNVIAERATLEDARLVGSAPEIMWPAYMAKVKAALPAGSSFVSWAIDGPSSLEAPSLPELLLQNPRVATVTVVVATPTVQMASAVLISLQGQPFYADSRVSIIAWDEEKRYYATTATLNITAEVFEKRFFDEADAETDTEG